MIVLAPLQNIWIVLASIGAFLFYALTYAIPSGYSYGAAFLLLVSLAYLFTKNLSWKFSVEDRAFVYIFLCVTAISLVIFLIHGDPPKTFDQSSRYILLIPILLFLLHVPPRLFVLWLGIAVGSISSAAIAIWQGYWLNIYRPSGFMTSAIPFGDISLMAGILCLAGMSWANGQTRNRRIWQIVLGIGFLAGLYTSVLSGSRGGWLAIPVVFILLCIAFLKKRGLRKAIINTVLLFIALCAVFAVQKNEVMERYDIAVTQTNNYVQQHNANTSVGLRLEAWRAAIMSIRERPILGWSYKDYTARLKELAVEKETSESITELANTHNNYLEVWLHQGVFGFLALLIVYIVPFWFFCERLRSENVTVQALAVGGASLLTSFFIFGLTQVILGRNNGVLFFGLTLVIFWACMRNEERRLAT